MEMAAIGVASILVAAPGPARAQDNPAGVAESAVAAVKVLGEQVVLGNRKFAVERMYPRWKERMAKRVGGMEALDKKMDEQIAAMEEQMRLHGMSVIAFNPVGVPKVYGVWPGKQTKVVDGQAVEILVKTKWMVLIPTVTKLRIFDKELSKQRFIESQGFQVAVSDKGKNEWSFMDGASLSVSDLRSLFPDLPENLELPKLERREAK
jgi:hypothetical protein